jgi:hypothetical protein
MAVFAVVDSQFNADCKNVDDMCYTDTVSLDAIVLWVSYRYVTVKW